MRRSMFGSGRLAALLVMGASALVAQGTQVANVSGEVIGKDGAPVAGVMVRLTSPSLQGTRVVTSDAKGRFQARLLPPGTYTIILTKDGMQQVKATNTIGIGQTFEPRYQMMPVGGTVVEVVASAGEIDKTDTKTATNYALDKVDALPTANRTLETVALLTPGVTSGVGGRPQIRGAMTSGNLYLLDGQNISDNAYNNRGVRLIDDSIEEIQVITGAISAEYGDVDGGVLNAITKSGGNQFAGQVRWELNNPQWNTYTPFQALGSLSNKLSEEKTFSLSGFIIKDKLWFSASFFQTDQNGVGTIGGNIPDVDWYNMVRDPDEVPLVPYNYQTPTGVGGAMVPYHTGNASAANGGYNANYDTGRKEIRRNAKLTYAINQNHTLVGSFNNSKIVDQNRNYSAGEIRALVPQVSTSEFMNLQWRAIWSDSLTSEVKMGRKKQLLSAGADPAGGSPIYSYDDGLYRNNGIFNSTDGGDNRNNETFNAKFSYFLDALGTHQFDAGVDYYKGTSKARNEQTATGYIFGVVAINLATRYAIPQDVWTYTSTEGEAQNISTALFVNDKWTLNRNLTFNIGLRFDKFSSKNESGGTTASATGFSPRLGVKYDMMADAKYVFGASYCKYNAKAATGVLNSVTGQGNPTEIDHPWIGLDSYNNVTNPRTFAEITNLANLATNYDLSFISFYDNPVVNVRLSPDLKAPSVTEIQGSFQYSFNFPAIGNGSVKVTGVYKNWNDLLDYRRGADGSVTLPDGNTAYVKVWENSDVAERKYKGLELEGTLGKGPWSVGGNVTWSELKGNYEGEGTSTPSRGEGLKSFTTQDGVAMYDSNVVGAPYGYLAGHVPIRVRANASYVSNNSFGKTTWGVIYRFDAGARYSQARTISRARINPLLSAQFGSSSTQYLGERGGAGTFQGLTYVDLAITHDFPLFKAYDKPVSGFVKLVIQNVFNHQQNYSWGTGYASATGVAGTPTGGLNSPWVPDSNNGKVTGSLQYGASRSYAISTGFRF
ncbi:MAG: TonB-dependent receptor [Holophaga sp.]|nr:TonB-dependent receptor [Holophaga sp.]